MNLICFDNVNAQLKFTDRSAFSAAYNALKFMVPGHKFMPAYRNGTWDGYISLFKKTNSTFPTGLIPLVAKAIEKKGLSVAYQDARDLSRDMKMPKDKDIENCLNGKTLRDYQIKSVKTVIKQKNGIIHAATGSGKTVIAAGFVRLARDAGLKCLFLVNKKELLYQTQDSFVSAGIPTTVIGDGKREYSDCCCATLQTLYLGLPVKKKGRYEIVDGKKAWVPATNRPGNPDIMNYLKSVDVVILDECHNGTSESVLTTMQHCPNALYRIGMTATPLMKSFQDDLKLMAITGDIISRITMKDLIDRGLLAQPYVKLIKINEPILPRTVPYGRAYKLGVVQNNHRNNLIIQEALDLAKDGKTILILVAQIQHGKILSGILSDYPGLKHKFIHGSKSKEIRREAIDLLKNEKINILISSTIADEGLDIPTVSAVILAGSGKSNIKLYQRIGRGMRPKEGENFTFIVDFIDLSQKHLAKHSLARYEILRDEPGFIIVENFSRI